MSHNLFRGAYKTEVTPFAVLVEHMRCFSRRLDQDYDSCMEYILPAIHRIPALIGVREHQLIAVVGARKLHLQRITPEIISLSRRLERELGTDSLGRTELVRHLDDL